MTTIDDLAHALHLTVDKVHILPDGLLTAAMKDWPLPAQAAVWQRVAEQRSESKSDVAKLLEKNEERAREPWRVAVQNASVDKTVFTKQTTTVQQQQFVEGAKAHRVSQEDVLTLTYLLFGAAESHRFYCGIILNKRGSARIQAHNWYVANAVKDSEAFLTAHGKTIQGLTVPLFPPVDELHGLNTALLLDAAAEGISGGGTPL